MPLASVSFVRRLVSPKSVLPPSMRMSPFDRCGLSSPISSSTAGPALTIIMIFRGDLRLPTSSVERMIALDRFALGRAFDELVGLLVVRLKTATEKPWLAMFRTRFCPMTARPTSPMSCCAM